MAEIKYSETDFAQIKENLKTFLKSQDKFKDYNFDGSSMSVLLDVLAYNTSYNAFYLNMVANEMFLDSAALRENVVSRAKHLGYVPLSRKTLSAVIDLTVEFASSLATIPDNFLLSTTQEFYTNYNDVRYTFYPKASVYFDKIVDGKYIARNVDLIEGKRLSHTYVVDTTTPIKQRFIVPNAGVDIATLVVTVKESATSSNIAVFTPNTDITKVSSDSPVYYLQPYQSDLYEIVFGEGVLGRAVVDGNIVILDYVASTGSGAEGARDFRTNRLNNLTVVGNQTATITTKTAASGYSDAQSIESIKLLAPRSYEAQNRAVTKSDYETLILSDVSSVEYIRVWGGEENVPPEYGKVFCAIKPKTGTTLNTDDKTRILNSFIRPRSMVSIEVIIVEPEYIGIVLDCSVNYFSNKTTLNADSIRLRAATAIEKYVAENLNGFDADFRYSKLVKYIDDADTSIESNITEVRLKYPILPTLNTRNQFSIVLNNPIDRGDYLNSISAVRSSEFFYNNARVSLSDDGQGNLFLYYISSESSKVIVESSVGSVSYDDGTITISNMLVSGIPNNQSHINLYIKPRYNDVVALRNQMLLIEPEDISIQVVDLSRLKLS